MKLAFIAVNYNNCFISANYVANVKAIRNIEAHDVQIIIVDNCSEYDDFQFLSGQIKDFDDTILVRTEKNLGYFGGLNYGIRQINYSEYDYVIVGNNDLFFERDFIKILEKKCYKDTQTVIVPDLETINGVHQNPQFIDVPSKGRQWGYRIYYSCYLFAVLIDILYKAKRIRREKQKKQRHEKEEEIFQCTGALILLRPSFFSHCGLLDDSLFLWGEEVALAHQLVLAGDKMLYDPDLKVIHMESASVGKIASYRKYKLWKKSYMIYKNYYYI